MRELCSSPPLAKRDDSCFCRRDRRTPCTGARSRGTAPGGENSTAKRPALGLVLVCILAALAPPAPTAAQTAGAGWIIGSIDIGEPLQGDVTYGGSSLFVGAGVYGAGSQHVLRLDGNAPPAVIVTGLNSIGGLTYDSGRDLLLFTDNGQDAGATTTGDTVYALENPRATATALSAATLELAPTGSIPYASAALPLDDSDAVLVGDAVGPGAGRVVSVDLSSGVISPLVSGLDYVAGLSLAADGDILIGNVDGSYVGSVLRWDLASSSLSAFASTAGAFDQEAYRDGSHLVTGVFGADWTSAIAWVSADGAPLGEIASGFSFTTGIDSDPVSGQVAVIDSCWPTPCTTITTLTPITALTDADRGTKDCSIAFFGGESEVSASGRVKPSWACSDGAACDRDGEADGTCTFLVGTCAAIAEIDGCTPDEVDAVEISRAPKVGGSSALPELTTAVEALLPTSTARCSAAVPISVDQGDVARIKIKARASGKVIDADNLKLRCD